LILEKSFVLSLNKGFNPVEQLTLKLLATFLFSANFCVDSNDRLRNVRATVGGSDANFDNPTDSEICDYLPGQPPGDVFTVTCRERIRGRFVRVTAVEIHDYLNIYEMQIFGYKTW